MKKLLSLPPNVVECFHKVSGRSPEEYFCTSDPADRKLGSGGGTIWLLEKARAAEGDSSFGEWLGREKRILLHAGGQSRRLPAYAPSGKVLTPVPVFRWARGQRLRQTLLDLQLPLYERIMQRAPEHLHTLVASGDVYIRATEALCDIPAADVVCFGLWADPVQASRHGVFMMERNNPRELDFMLQKPSIEEQRQLMQTHYTLMDIGIWLLSDRAVEVLRRKCAAADAEGGVGNYDLYGEFGCGLGLHPSRFDGELAGLTVKVLPLPGGEFYHFGSTPELISSSEALQNLVKDQRLIIQQNVKQQPSVFTQNCVGVRRPEAANVCVWVENSFLHDGWRYSSHNVITGVPENNWNVTLADGICVDIVPIGEGGYAVRPYGYDDAFRGAVGGEATFLNRPLLRWLEARGLSPEALGNTADIQAAELFPVADSADEAGAWLEWMLSDAPDAARSALYLGKKRLSADGLSQQANLQRLAEQRRRLHAMNLPALAGNWQKSVFYQVDLKDLAEEYAAEGLALPAELSAGAPMMMRIHDAMFRSEVLERSGRPEAAAEADRAFGLLREALTDNALCRKCMPRMTTYADQIVWARSSVRIDLAGGWTDTPPYTLMAGGNVVNAAIELNGQPPLQVYVKPCSEPKVICRSIDLGAMEEITTYDELRLFNKVGSPFSIPKAALALAGFLPEFCAERFASLREQLQAFGCGLEITLLAAIPAGSGLGTSSILAATVLGGLSDFCGLGWDKNEVANRTLVLEQLLTTGGGWQDQYGGVLHGVKLLQTNPGFDQNAVARWLPDTLFTAPELRPCHLLYYTGVTRTAKHILTEIVRGMFLNNTNHLALLDEMKQHALGMYDAIQLGDLAAYGKLLRATWEQNKALDAGTNPPVVEELCRRIDDLCLGYKLPGAGGGGFMYMVAKDAAAAARIRTELNARPLTPCSRFVEMNISTTGLQVSRS